MNRPSYEALTLLLAALVLFPSHQARADHPDIDAAREAYEATRFEDALELLSST